jgi:hypothetical protein
MPIILRTVNWQRAPFARLQAVPRHGKPVKTWSSQDDAFDDVARRLREVSHDSRRATS